jgi:hypothetical protein
MPSKLSWEKLKSALATVDDPGGYRKIAEQAGGFENLGTVVDEARTGGPTAPSIASVPKEDLSKLDRYAHGGNAYKFMPPVVRDTPLGLAGTAIVGGAYEASKALPAYFGNAVAAATDPSYSHDPNTSKPSLANWLNLMRGYADAQSQGQAGYLRSVFGKGK